MLSNILICIPATDDVVKPQLEMQSSLHRIRPTTMTTIMTPTKFWILPDTTRQTQLMVSDKLRLLTRNGLKDLFQNASSNQENKLSDQNCGMPNSKSNCSRKSTPRNSTFNIYPCRWTKFMCNC